MVRENVSIGAKKRPFYFILVKKWHDVDKYGVPYDTETQTHDLKATSLTL